MMEFTVTKAAEKSAKTAEDFPKMPVAEDNRSGCVARAIAWQRAEPGDASSAAQPLSPLLFAALVRLCSLGRLSFRPAPNCS